MEWSLSDGCDVKTSKLLQSGNASTTQHRIPTAPIIEELSVSSANQRSNSGPSPGSRRESAAFAPSAPPPYLQLKTDQESSTAAVGWRRERLDISRLLPYRRQQSRN